MARAFSAQRARGTRFFIPLDHRPSNAQGLFRWSFSCRSCALSRASWPRRNRSTGRVTFVRVPRTSRAGVIVACLRMPLIGPHCANGCHTLKSSRATCMHKAPILRPTLTLLSCYSRAGPLGRLLSLLGLGGHARARDDLAAALVCR